MLNFFSIARPSCPSFQTEMKQNLTFGFSFTILVQPPLLSSPWQFEHHGAQRCTTLISGDLIASKTFCSAGDSARTDMAARMAMNSGVRGIPKIFGKGGFLFYDSNAGRDVEADAGLPRRKHRQGTDLGNSSAGGIGRRRVQIRGRHSVDRI